jgi:hypothetical protein
MGLMSNGRVIRVVASVKLKIWGGNLPPKNCIPYLSQRSRSGYHGGRVSEGQLMETKDETIQDLENFVVVAGWSRN